MKIVVVLNEKGGVGKTQTSFNLSLYSAEQGLRTLGLDTDTQGNYSQFLTGDLSIKHKDGGIKPLFLGETFEPLITPSGIHLLHGHRQLDVVDSAHGVFERISSPQFRYELRSLPYDVIVVDTPTAMNIRHSAPLYWADVALIPVEPSLAATDAVESVVDTIKKAQALNPSLRFKIVINKVKSNSKTHEKVVNLLRNIWGERVIAVLGDRAAVADSILVDPPKAVWRYRGAKRDLRESWKSFCDQVING
ncbi:ParA family protein [Chromobacterium vaccinii]|uniref:ParA family protein n=1 Tax=Chromobacterium vaccinii TaxID=1108595 RepID=UPI003C74691B